MDKALEMSKNLLKHMKVLYGKKFIDQWKEIPQELLEKMLANSISGLSEEQIEYGFNKMNLHEWPPTIPEFRKWCCSYGIQGLTAQEAWLQALEYEQSNESINITAFTKQTLLNLKKVYKIIDQTNELHSKLFMECFKKIKEEALINGKSDSILQPKRSILPENGQEEQIELEEYKPVPMPEELKAIMKFIKKI